jgi:hypothetical protein
MKPAFGTAADAVNAGFVVPVQISSGADKHRTARGTELLG